MKTLPARWIALASLALALVWICSCSDDETCPTCPKPAACHDPSKALLGTWVVFESTVAGSPDQVYLGMQWNFLDDDTLMVHMTTPYVWSANDSIVFIMSAPNPSTEFMAFSYEVEADTLNLRGKTGIPFSVYWRFHRTP